MNADTAARQHGLDADAIAVVPPPARTPDFMAGLDAAAPMQRTRRRRRMRLAGFLLCVAVPTALVGGYLFTYAADQYTSGFRFTVRQQQPLKSTPGGLGAAMAGGNPLLAVLANSEVVVQYLKSHQVVDDISRDVDLAAIYGKPADDWWSRLQPGSPAEKRLRYWNRVVDPFFDMTTGVVSVTVRAFSPQDAQRVAATALAASEHLVNTMSQRAHHDAVAYAEQQTAEAEARLRRAEASIAAYRNRNAVLFPQVQATASATFEGQLRSQLADARTTLSGLRSQGVHDGAQTRILEGRISAMEGELASAQAEMTRQSPGQSSAPAGSTGTASGSPADAGSPLASVLSGYNSLDFEERISEKIYERALNDLQDARNEADQQLVYLDAFVQPELPQESTYPIRWRVMLETALGGFVAWCLAMLLLHGIRDHLD